MQIPRMQMGTAVRIRRGDKVQVMLNTFMASAATVGLLSGPTMGQAAFCAALLIINLVLLHHRWHDAETHATVAVTLAMDVPTEADSA